MEDILKGVSEKRDYLTNVYERSVVEEAARLYIEQKSPFTFMLVDVDNFKNINDGYGHAVGDKIIVAVANRLREAVGSMGFVGRFGGDEFFILMAEELDYDKIWNFCHDLLTSIECITFPEYPSIVLTVTLGLSRFPLDGGDYETIFEKADKALYRGKIKGRGCFIIYLDEKHRDIKLLSSKDSALNSMQMHNQIFKILTKGQNLRESIPVLIKFLSTNLMIDHLGLQGKSKLLFKEAYPIARCKEFEFIDNSLIAPNISEAMGIFYVNEIHRWKISNQEALRGEIERQEIGSVFFSEISYGERFYGYLRADTCGPCIWQNDKMDLLITVAKAIAMRLHEEKLEIDELA